MNGEGCKTIWCLFERENNYDQPPNCLVAWWGDKPSLDQLSSVLHGSALADLADQLILSVVNIWKGGHDTDGDDTEFWLELIPEGVKFA